METGRIFKPCMVTSIDDLVEALEAREVVICVKGESYDLLKDRIIQSHREAKRELTAARIGQFISLSPAGIGLSQSRLYNAKQNLFVKYDIQDQPLKKCLDLVRVKGKGAFKPKTDKIDDKL